MNDKDDDRGSRVRRSVSCGNVSVKNKSLKASAVGNRSSPGATICVEWGYELHEITLTPRNWSRVKRGLPLSIRGKGYWYEGEFFWDYWTFSGGLDGELLVTYGSDSGIGFDGSLNAAEIMELPCIPKRRYLITDN